MRKLPALLLIVVLLLSIVGCTAATPTPAAVPTTEGSAAQPTAASAEPVTLRVAVTLNAEALQDFEKGIAAIEAAHPEWNIEVEAIPQEGRLEKITAEIASQTLPDLLLTDGSSVQQWIRQGAFADLTKYIANDSLDLTTYYAGPLEQFAYNGSQYGIPYDGAPEVVYYNKGMFDAAGVDYPTDDMTFDEMREVAKLLTLDANGNNATSPDFDPTQVVQWGWNSTPNHIWARHYIQARGGDICTNADCTIMDYTSPEVVEAFRYWADMAQVDHTAPYDVYTGGQTGVPGDPFVAGVAAMGFNNIAFAPQLNNQTEIQYDVVQPFVGVDGNRYGPISTEGILMSANTQHADAAWALLRELTGESFLSEYVAKPGHGIPALRSAAPAFINADKLPANQQSAIDAMEYETILRPFSASSFEAYGKTSSLFVEAMKGDRPLEEVLAEIQTAANDALAKDIEQ